MAISEARKRANDKYIKDQDEIKIRVKKGYKEVIQEKAKFMGLSVNSYINGLIEMDIETDA